MDNFIPNVSKNHYYMAESKRGQDETNPDFLRSCRMTKFIFWPFFVLFCVFNFINRDFVSVRKKKQKRTLTTSSQFDLLTIRIVFKCSSSEKR